MDIRTRLLPRQGGLTMKGPHAHADGAAIYSPLCIACQEEAKTPRGNDCWGYGCLACMPEHKEDSR